MGDLVNNAVISSISPVARLRGGRPLGPEESVNSGRGEVFDPSGGLAQGFFDGRPIVDVELGVDLARGATLSIGGQNVFDIYSQESVIANAVGERYSEYMPWGYSGAYYCARIGYSWGN